MTKRGPKRGGHDAEVRRVLDSFLARYEDAIAAQVQDVRVHLSSRFPQGFELVYDNYNALVFGLGPTDRASDALVSVAAYPRWVTLFFLKGADLPDPAGVLQGAGSRVRSVRLTPPSVLQSKPVQALLDVVGRQARKELALAPPLTTVVKSVSKKQRPRKAPPVTAVSKGKRSGGK